MEKIVKRNFKSLNDLAKEGIRTRVVKAENGLMIRDAAGKKIGAYKFGELAYILDYAEGRLYGNGQRDQTQW